MMIIIINQVNSKKNELLEFNLEVNKSNNPNLPTFEEE